MKHPPKNKKKNRERPIPTPPLEDKARLQKASQEFAKALTLLNEAKILAKNGGTPHACTHTVYFAMYHCARAALLQSGGVGKAKDVPDSHEHVIQHFGNLPDQGLAGPISLGQVLNRARGERVLSDYDLVEQICDIEAAESVAEANEFVERCRSIWHLKTITENMVAWSEAVPLKGAKLILSREST